MTNDDYDPIEELERLDRFFDGEEPGQRPIDVMRERGMVIPEDGSLADAPLHAKLWELIEAMAGLGLFLDSTDHLSDRELYRYLVSNALLEETCIFEGSAGGWHLSPIGGWSEADVEVYLRYYADEDTRELWTRDRTTPLPERAPPPFDRDRLLPGAFAEGETEGDA